MQNLKETQKVECEVKDKVNTIIDELILCDSSDRMSKEVSTKIDRVDAGSMFDFEQQLLYTHLLNIGNIISELSHKSIHFTKSALREYKESTNPIWIDIVNKNVA